jgi:hypothetical protein
MDDQRETTVYFIVFLNVIRNADVFDSWFWEESARTISTFLPSSFFGRDEL